MESPDAEYRGEGGGGTAAGKLEHLSDQYKSMRELLKVYGLSVSEDKNNPQKGKRRNSLNSAVKTHRKTGIPCWQGKHKINEVIILR